MTVYDVHEDRIRVCIYIWAPKLKNGGGGERRWFVEKQTHSGQLVGNTPILGARRIDVGIPV